MKHDRTFEAICAYGSDGWCVARIGVSLDNFCKTVRKRLMIDGFPPKNRITGLTLKADVDAWLEKRSRVADAGPRRVEMTVEAGGANLAVL